MNIIYIFKVDVNKMYKKLKKILILYFINDMLPITSI